MADVEVGKFDLVEVFRHPSDVRGGLPTTALRFRAAIAPAPNVEWQEAFNELMASERATGNSPGDRLSIQGEVTQFEAPESMARAAADLIRRVVERTNPEVVKRDSERRKQFEGAQKQDEDEQRRLREKFRDGI